MLFPFLSANKLQVLLIQNTTENCPITEYSSMSLHEEQERIKSGGACTSFVVEEAVWLSLLPGYEVRPSHCSSSWYMVEVNSASSALDW